MPFRLIFTQGKGGALAANVESYTYLCSHERPPQKSFSINQFGNEREGDSLSTRQSKGEEDRRTLVDISKGWQYQRLDACDLLLVLRVNMQSWSSHAICQCWSDSKALMEFEDFLQETSVVREEGEFGKYKIVSSHRKISGLFSKQ